MSRQNDVTPIQNALLNAIAVTGPKGLLQEEINEYGSRTVGVANIQRSIEALVRKGFVQAKPAASRKVRYVARPFLRRVCVEGLPALVFESLAKERTLKGRAVW